MKTSELYALRKDAIAKFKKAMKGKAKITSLTKNEKSLLTADMKLDGKVLKIKVAQKKNVSILFEVLNDGKVSWFSKTRANLFCMIYVEPKIAYMIPILAVKDYVSNPLNKVDVYKTDSGTVCWSIPIETLMKHNLIIDVIHLA